MTRRITSLAILAVLVLGLPAYAANVAIDIKGNSYQPDSETVSPGDTVIWTNRDPRDHTVTSDSGAFNGRVGSGESFNHRFRTSGSFPYHCTIHTGMRGTIFVTGGGAAPPPSPPPSPSPQTSPSPRQSPSPPPPPPPNPPAEVPPDESPAAAPAESPSPTIEPPPEGAVQPSAPAIEAVDVSEEQDTEGLPGILAIALVAGLVAGISGLGLWYLRKADW